MLSLSGMLDYFLISIFNTYVDLGLPDADPSSLETNIKNLVFGIAAVVALFFLVTSGFKYVTSGGNAEQTKKAAQTIVFACLGLFMILFSYSIITWVFRVGGA
jgi:hypothetical protein